MTFLFKKKLEQLVTGKEQSSFKKAYTLEQRIMKCKSIDEKYTGSRQRGTAFIVLERGPNSKLKEFKKPFKLQSLSRYRFAIEKEMRIFDLMAYIRKLLKTGDKESLFLIVGRNIANSNYTIGELYNTYKQQDGFMYILVSQSEVF